MTFEVHFSPLCSLPGFSHSAFTFAYESLVIKSSVAQTEIPPGALITFLQKGLEYIAIEEHINEDGSIQEFDNNYSLLSPLISEAVAVKEDRRVRRQVPSSSGSTMQSSSHTSAAAAASLNGHGQSDAVPMDEESEAANAAASGEDSSSAVVKPSTIQLM